MLSRCHDRSERADLEQEDHVVESPPTSTSNVAPRWNQQYSVQNFQALAPPPEFCRGTRGTAATSSAPARMHQRRHLEQLHQTGWRGAFGHSGSQQMLAKRDQLCMDLEQEDYVVEPL